MKVSPWFVYIIQNERGHLYTGVTTDLERRFMEHSTGKKGAKFFRSGAPITVLFKKKFIDRSSALKFEARIKKLSRPDKVFLIENKKVRK